MWVQSLYLCSNSIMEQIFCGHGVPALVEFGNSGFGRSYQEQVSLHLGISKGFDQTLKAPVKFSG